MCVLTQIWKDNLDVCLSFFGISDISNSHNARLTISSRSNQNPALLITETSISTYCHRCIENGDL